MNNCQFRAAGALIIAVWFWSLACPAQTTKIDFRVKGIKQTLIDAPAYGGVGTAEMGGGRPATLARKWLRIEAHFESAPEWADDVQLKFFTLLGKGKEARLFVGDVTHINVAKGSQHYSAMFVHPNTVKRFGNGLVEAVAVQVFYKGQLMGSLSEPPSNKRWWEEFTPIPNFLLNPMQSPWSVVASERWEAQKPAGAATP